MGQRTAVSPFPEDGWRGLKTVKHDFMVVEAEGSLDKVFLYTITFIVSFL